MEATYNSIATHMPWGVLLWHSKVQPIRAQYLEDLDQWECSTLVLLLPVSCRPESSPSDKNDDQDDVEKAAQDEGGADDDLKDDEDDGCAGINLHHCIG